jgi:hypothetical protein
MTSYSKEDIKKAIAEANAKEIAVSFKGMAPITPGWDKFIHLIHSEIHGAPNTTIPNSPLEERMINGVIIRNLFYLTVRISKLEMLSESSALIEVFSDIFNTEILPVSAFINIIGGEKPGEAHKDNRETIFWQCHGVSEWTLYETPESPKYETSELKIYKKIRLDPGDVLYLRNQGIHSVQNFGPRASIAFMPDNRN